MIRRSSESGQMTIEMVLMVTILFGLIVTITGLIKQQQILAAVVEGPWASMQGMIEDGVWQPAGSSKAGHPSLRRRHRSYEGEAVKEGT